MSPRLRSTTAASSPFCFWVVLTRSISRFSRPGLVAFRVRMPRAWLGSKGESGGRRKATTTASPTIWSRISVSLAWRTPSIWSRAVSSCSYFSESNQALTVGSFGNSAARREARSSRTWPRRSSTVKTTLASGGISFCNSRAGETGAPARAAVASQPGSHWRAGAGYFRFRRLSEENISGSLRGGLVERAVVGLLERRDTQEPEGLARGGRQGADARRQTIPHLLKQGRARRRLRNDREDPGE